jgi:2-dehydro-3-deoxyglucarate aldolase/4-hydroxy-2-oxoheptanedioate aldolase
MAADLRTLLRQGRLVRVFALGHLFRPEMVEMVGWLGGFDAVWFDLEHTPMTAADVAAGARAARACGLHSFARLAATDYAAVMRPLEAGAGGVMAAMVRSAAQAEELVRWAKFHPHGLRGVNSTGPDGRHGTLPLLEYLQRANARTAVGVQVENVEAVDDVERIAAVAELDFLFVGPADLSQSMGIPGQWDHPRLWQAIERVARAAAGRNLAWAILPASPAHARRYVELGCRMLSIGLDAWAFARGLRAFQDEYAEFFKD